MTTLIAKEHLAHLERGSAAYGRPAIQGLEGTVADLRRPSLRALLARPLEVLASWSRRRAVLAELSMLSDRELADIGLDRMELKRVFEPSFEAKRRRRA